MRRLIFAFTTAVIALASPHAASAFASASASESGPPDISPLCRPYLDEPRDAISVIFRWDQRLSFASCLRATTRPVPAVERGDVDALPALITRLEQAFATPISIYRDAMSFGPPEIRIQGAYGLASTYLEIAIRARSALDPTDERGRFALEPLLQPTLRSAIAAFDEVAFLAEDHPKAARANAVVDFSVRNARVQVRLLRGK